MVSTILRASSILKIVIVYNMGIRGRSMVGHNYIQGTRRRTFTRMPIDFLLSEIVAIAHPLH